MGRLPNAPRQVRLGCSVPSVQAIGGTLGQSIVIGAHRLQLRFVEWDAEPAVDDETDRDVCQRKAVTHEIGAVLRQMGIEPLHLVGPIGDAFFDELLVLEGGQLRDQTEEWGADAPVRSV